MIDPPFWHSLPWPLDASTIVAVAGTYLLHSTLFLVATWIILRRIGGDSPTLESLLWRTAALAGIVSTSLHFLFGMGPNSPQWLSQSMRLSQTSSIPTATSSDRPETLPPPIANPDQVAFPGSAREHHDSAHGNHSHALDPQRHSSGTRSWPLVVLETERLSTNDPRRQDALSSGKNRFPYPTPAAQPRRAAANDAQLTVPRSGTPSPRSSPKWWISALILGWFVMASALLVRRALTTSIYTWRLPRIADERALRILADACVYCENTRPPRLIRSRRLESPSVVGILCPSIILPPKCEEQLSDRELKALFMHEIAHIKRGDLIWVWIGNLLCGPGAIQPLNRLARQRWQRAGEILCDQWAVEKHSCALSLARCLVKLSEYRSVSNKIGYGLFAVGHEHPTFRRIALLTRSSSETDRWNTLLNRRLVCSIAILAILAFTATCPGGRIDAGSNDEEGMNRTSANRPVSRGNSAHGSETASPPSSDSQLAELDRDLEQLKHDLDVLNRLSTDSDRQRQLKPVIENLNRSIDRFHLRRQNMPSSVTKGNAK